MEVWTSRTQARIEDDAFEGKKVLVDGQLFSHGFCIYKRPKWLVLDPQTNKYVELPMEEEKIPEILNYLHTEGKKINFPFLGRVEDFER